MSRLSALKEFAFMQVLRKSGFSVPEPLAQSRHTVVMELVDAFPLRQIREVPNPAGLYSELIDIVLQLASFGLIHGDFNEFNILIREDEKSAIEEAEHDTQTNKAGSKPSITLTPVIIDFPQMVSIDHTNAEMYFDRDINCIKQFFQRRFNFVSDEPGPFFSDAKMLAGGKMTRRLDVEVEASGFSKKMAKELHKYMQEIGVDSDGIHREVGDMYEGEDSINTTEGLEIPDESFSGTYNPEESVQSGQECEHGSKSDVVVPSMNDLSLENQENS